MKRMSVFLGVFCWVFALTASDLARRADELTRTEMQSVMQFLGHDLLEGRATGTRGGELAERYCQSMFQWMGLAPGHQGGYFQPFTMKGFVTRELIMEAGGQRLGFRDDVVGSWVRESTDFSVEGEAVFAGFGIRSEAWGWDDFKQADLKGKVLIVRVSDPGSVDPRLFEGQTMTYFGRWTYKIEAAARAGAKAILLIHTDRSAGYDWTVVQNSWSGEQLHLPQSLDGPLEFRGWIREEALARVLAARGLPLEKLYAASMKRGFWPIPLNLRVTLRGRSEFRRVEARNVVAEIPGRRPERVVLVAHLDHLGSTRPGGEVFNGTIDNGSAVTALLLTARILNEHRGQLPCSVSILASQAEEEGLLGSTHYVGSTDRQNILAAISFESTPVWGESGSLMGIGARHSTLEDLLKEIAAVEKVDYREFSMSDRGFFFRSDQFSFAQYGIPAVWLSAGEEVRTGSNPLRDFFTGTYHTVRDDFDPAWDLGALRQTIKYAVMLVERIGQAKAPPRWKSRLAFPVR